MPPNGEYCPLMYIESQLFPWIKAGPLFLVLPQDIAGFIMDSTQGTWILLNSGLDLDMATTRRQSTAWIPQTDGALNQHFARTGWSL